MKLLSSLAFTFSLFFCLIPLMTPLHAEVLFTDPFSNRILSWDLSGVKDKVNNSLLAQGMNTSGYRFGVYTPPVVWHQDEVLFTTDDGEIILFHLRNHHFKKLYQAEGHCSAELAHQGCLYSMVLVGPHKVYFLEHQQNQLDIVKEVTLQGVRTLVTAIPSPQGSGPLWIRPNGHLGALPYNVGIVELQVPSPGSPTLSYQQALLHFTPLSTMASVVFEGHSALGVFDFEQFKLFTPDTHATSAESSSSWRPLFSATSAVHDPCSGLLWGIGENQRFFPFSRGLFPLISVNSKACPLITEWKILRHEGGTESNKQKAALIQGFPSGRPKIPSTQVLSLGRGGALTLESTRMIEDGPGIDLRVFENAFSFGSEANNIYGEVAKVEIYDEQNHRWVSTGCDCQNPTITQCAGLQVTSSYPGSGVSPWSEQAGGFPIDLGEYALTSAINKIRITDCEKATAEAPSSPETAGFDLDGIIVNPSSLK